MNQDLRKLTLYRNVFWKTDTLRLNYYCLLKFGICIPGKKYFSYHKVFVSWVMSDFLQIFLENCIYGYFFFISWKRNQKALFNVFSLHRFVRFQSLDVHPTHRALVVNYDVDPNMLAQLGDFMMKESRQSQKL